MSTRWLRILVGAFSIWAGAGEAQAQSAGPAATLAAMDLEQKRVGRVETHYAASDEGRATDMAELVEEAAGLFEAELGVMFPISLAALGPADWFSEFPGVPYAIPWASITEHLLILPSSLEVGVLASGPYRAANERRTDFVALHELGHVAAAEFFDPAGGDSSVPWFHELVATYFAYSYVAAVDPQWANAAKREWQGQVDAFEPTVRSLDWAYMNQLSGPAVAQEYGWYQFLLNLRAADLHERYGIGLIRELRDDLDWANADSWTSDSLLQRLESTVPGLVAWARSFEAA